VGNGKKLVTFRYRHLKDSSA